MLPDVSALAALLGALHFLGNPQCPDARQVEAEVRRLNPTAFDGEARHLVLLQLEKAGLEIRLFDEDGKAIEERSIRASKTCEEWAKTTAVVLVTWEAELTGPTPPLPEFTMPLAPPRVAPVAVSATASASTDHPPRWSGEIGAGLAGAIAGDGLGAPGVEIRAAVGPAGQGYGGQLTLLAIGSRSVPLGPGSVSWERFAVGLGGHMGTARKPKRLLVELDADFLLSLLMTSGDGFTLSRAATAVDPGVMISARLGWSFGSLLAWMQLSGVGWLRAEQAQVFTGPTPAFSVSIPQVEFLGVLGLSLAGPL